ncbi:hypothetical protein BVG19_g4966 [[Candida] boidinii]|nr:hypothetical protein BVG19_g4966 [[Candida] boidinii]OWB49882.1 hypothetical protein B5S27_g1427 [[Candida] boidinii]OWB82955.1 hypothetical protein B5S33_g1584 [[Candida] boidinii]
MSNIEVAQLYEKIIEDVIQESRQDFEDSGIDEQTLQDLRNLWRQKLSQTSVAAFTWDTNDDDDDDSSSSKATSSATAATSNTDTSAPSVSSISTGLQVPSSSSNTVAGAKSEPSELAVPKPKAEDDASSSIVLPGGARIGQSDGGNNDIIEFEISMSDLKKNKKLMKKFKNLKNSNLNKKINQSDGPSDFLDDDDIDDDDDDDDEVDMNGNNNSNAQEDEDEDDDDLGMDSDEINSDLDDPEDDEIGSDEDGDDPEVNIMLCLYDRVQRVKNKWKCNLKDGIANIEGKDYAFQKANGESEW